MSQGRIYWYEVELVPLVGFVHADDAEHAKDVARDVARDLLPAYLDAAELRVEPIQVTTEVVRDANT